MFQAKHFGVEIPKKEQPLCTHCNGHMAIARMEQNGSVDFFWYCLSDEGEGDFEQHTSWFKDNNFLGWEFFYPSNEIWRERARREGLRSAAAPADLGKDSKGVVMECIDSPNWGGNHCASETEDTVLAWTGYLGQVAEEWRPYQN